MPGRAPLKWKAARLGGLCALNRERGADSGAYVGIEHIVPGRNRISGMGRASDYVTKRPFQAQNILYAKLGPEANKVWLATCGGQCSTDILPIRVTSGLVSPGFLAHVMAGSGFVRHAVSASSGTIMPRTPWRDIQRFLVPVPPMREQQKIASILSNVDALMGNVEELSARHAAMKRALGQSIFGITFRSLKWTTKQLSEVVTAKPQYGVSDSAMQYDPALARYIRITDIREDGNLDDGIKVSTKLDGNERYLLRQNDLLFARTGSVGRTFLVKQKLEKTVFASYLIRFNIDPSKAVPAYLEQYTRSDAYWSWVDSRATQSVQPNINAKQFSKLQIPVPPMPEQRRIASILSGVDAPLESHAPETKFLILIVFFNIGLKIPTLDNRSCPNCRNPEAGCALMSQ